MDRRKWIKRAAIGSIVSAMTYPFLEAKWCRVRRVPVTLPNLGRAFEGLTVAFLSDIHHGPFVPRGYVRSIVGMTNALKPDIVGLGGDYCYRGAQYIAPALEELSHLQAPLGRFAVLGNHDHWDGLTESIDGLEAAKIPLLRNQGVWLEKGGDRLRIGGVGDLWCDHQNMNAALGDSTTDDAVIILSHNPDTAETVRDRRVGLMLSGHTHGGQVIVPFYGAPIVPSAHGQKYLQGLTRGPGYNVFISRGVGTVGPPCRIFCRPEIVLLTLTGRPSGWSRREILDQKGRI
jgi:predicted MPP superfamily phosphohydrolase